MRKRDELSNPNSCLNKAREDEVLFVLIARDEDAPGTIRDWIKRKVARGRQPDDPKLLEAEQCAREMESSRA